MALGRSMLESCASRAMGSSACAAQCQGLGAAPGTTPCPVEPLLRSGTKDRKYSSGWSKAPTTPGTECRRNSQRIPEGIVQASCFYYRVSQEGIFNVSSKWFLAHL